MAIPEDPIERLKQLWEDFSSQQRELVLLMADAMRHTPGRTIDPDSDLAKNQGFVERFTNGLLLHHALTPEPLRKTSFEYLFVEASRAGGSTASVGSSATHPGADVVVDGVGFSLKTEAAKNLSDRSVRISKLRECAAAKLYTDPQQYLDYIASTVVPQLAKSERVITLRAKRKSALEQPRKARRKSRDSPVIEAPSELNSQGGQDEIMRYSLVEIPAALLTRMSLLTADDFTTGRAGEANAKVLGADGKLAFRLRFDGSDQKITVSSLAIRLCQTHIEWRIPLPQDAPPLIETDEDLGDD